MLRKMSIGLAWFSFSSGVLAHSLYPRLQFMKSLLQS